MNAASPALQRLVALLQLPDGGEGWWWVDGHLRNATTGRRFAVVGGVLDLLGDRFRPTFIQRLLDTRFTAAVYDAFRERGLRMTTSIKTFDDEVAMTAERLCIGPGQTILDLACGHGNFTVEWGRCVGEAGLVAGVDISRAMLRRAVRRVERSGLQNVALVRGDALDLPFRDGAFDGVNCSGGFHQLPDRARAMAEIARVLKPGGMLTASTMARMGDGAGGGGEEKRRYLFDLEAFRATAEGAGFEDYRAEMKGRSWGYLWARRRGG